MVYSTISQGLKTIDIAWWCKDTAQALVCVSLDGAHVHMSARNGVAKNLFDTVPQPAIVTNCVAHRLELCILYAAKKVSYTEDNEGVIKII